MKVLFTVLFLCLVTYSYAALYLGFTPPEKMEGHEYECWHEDVGYIPEGQKRRLPNECAVIECRLFGEYNILGCGNVGAETPCDVVKGDLSKPYPDCCFDVNCPSDEINKEEEDS